MKNLLYIFYLITILLSVVGCYQRSDVRILLEVADSLITHQPDSTLHMLDKLDQTDGLNREEQMQYVWL